MDIKKNLRLSTLQKNINISADHLDDDAYN